MSHHLLVAGRLPSGPEMVEPMRVYLTEWLENDLRPRIKTGDCAMSELLTGAVAEQALSGSISRDWVEAMDRWLSRPSDGAPLAYSEAFGRRLCGFQDQWEQVTIHSVHSRWWVECGTAGEDCVDHERFVDILATKDSGGWIYDGDVSPTTTRHRMKSELFLGLAMALEIYGAANRLPDVKASAVMALEGQPASGYVSAEYFRLRALAVLGRPDLVPDGVTRGLEACALADGVCDFDVAAKIDPYMGTRKRVGRDVTVRSPISTAQAVAVFESLGCDSSSRVLVAAEAFADDLSSAVDLDSVVEPFRMRDVPVPFGPGLTPLEVLNAASLVEWRGSRGPAAAC